MLNEWRVDRTEYADTPCGMNSIRYLGESQRDALRTFNALLPGFDAWDQPAPAYGVLLSRWDTGKCEYVAVGWKTCTGEGFLRR